MFSAGFLSVDFRNPSKESSSCMKHGSGGVNSLKCDLCNAISVQKCKVHKIIISKEKQNQIRQIWYYKYYDLHVWMKSWEFDLNFADISK